MLCNTPAFNNRVDDIFMVNTQVGYAVSGNGTIVKTIDSGEHWFLLNQDDSIYCRSVEFVDSLKGFVGGFPTVNASTNIFRKTVDGGVTWTDLTSLIDARAKKGICGLSIADSLTVYGCGNWFEDSAYIVKSIDGGTSWSFIDMHSYATSLIDLYFINKDTGFATGRGPLPLQTAVILYTTDGGLSWTYKFQNNVYHEYCWKIQHLNDQVYFASIQDFTSSPSTILKSIDQGMNWTAITVDPTNSDIQGMGFLDTLTGWAGGGLNTSFETNDGGITWNPLTDITGLNRVFKVNDTLIFATGVALWKYKFNSNGIPSMPEKTISHSTISSYPNPVNDHLIIKLSLVYNTRVLIALLDETGKEIRCIDNSDKKKDDYRYNLNTKEFKSGLYTIVLRTHEDIQSIKVMINH